MSPILFKFGPRGQLQNYILDSNLSILIFGHFTDFATLESSKWNSYLLKKNNIWQKKFLGFKFLLQNREFEAVSQFFWGGRGVYKLYLPGIYARTEFYFEIWKKKLKLLFIIAQTFQLDIIFNRKRNPFANKFFYHALDLCMYIRCWFSLYGFITDALYHIPSSRNLVHISSKESSSIMLTCHFVPILSPLITARIVFSEYRKDLEGKAAVRAEELQKDRGNQDDLRSSELITSVKSFAILGLFWRSPNDHSRFQSSPASSIERMSSARISLFIHPRKNDVDPNLKFRFRFKKFVKIFFAS